MTSACGTGGNSYCCFGGGATALPLPLPLPLPLALLVLDTSTAATTCSLLLIPSQTTSPLSPLCPAPAGEGGKRLCCALAGQVYPAFTLFIHLFCLPISMGNDRSKHCYVSY